MNKLILFSLLIFPLFISADFDNKCSVIITLRFQSNDDAYKDAIDKINQCEKYDILSVTSFLEESISKVYITDLSKRMMVATENLRQSMLIFIPFAMMSVVLNVDNLLLGKIWFGLRIVYLFGHIIDLYRFPLIRPIIWLPSIVVLVMMGLNLYVS